MCGGKADKYHAAYRYRFVETGIKRFRMVLLHLFLNVVVLILAMVLRPPQVFLFARKTED